MGIITLTEGQKRILDEWAKSNPHQLTDRFATSYDLPPHLLEEVNALGNTTAFGNEAEICDYLSNHCPHTPKERVRRSLTMDLLKGYSTVISIVVILLLIIAVLMRG